MLGDGMPTRRGFLRGEAGSRSPSSRNRSTHPASLAVSRVAGDGPVEARRRGHPPPGGRRVHRVPDSGRPMLVVRRRKRRTPFCKRQ
ncbi:hypothetical protein NL676_006050 [Syzygium grande]|nr:hypothetical protein NL676_006050 [Syzygium grande]